MIHDNYLRETDESEDDIEDDEGDGKEKRFIILECQVNLVMPKQDYKIYQCIIYFDHYIFYINNTNIKV